MSEQAKILVVDDEEVVRLSHKRVLASDHCKVEAVWNGQDALRAMEQESYTTWCSWTCGCGDGRISVLKAIKQKWPDSEVIVVTGYPEIETAKEAVKLGAYDYLAKPVGPDEVISAVNGAMLHKRWALRREHPNSGFLAIEQKYSDSGFWLLADEPVDTADKSRSDHERDAQKSAVVDDDPVVGKSFNRVLSQKGYVVVTAKDGHEALNKLQEG